MEPLRTCNWVPQLAGAASVLQVQMLFRAQLVCNLTFLPHLLFIFLFTFTLDSCILLSHIILLVMQQFGLHNKLMVCVDLLVWSVNSSCLTGLLRLLHIIIYTDDPLVWALVRTSLKRSGCFRVNIVTMTVYLDHCHSGPMTKFCAWAIFWQTSVWDGWCNIGIM